MAFRYGLTPSSTPSWNSGGTSHIMAGELKTATFDVEKMTNFLDGGAEKTKKRRWIVSQTEGDDFSHRSETNRLDQMKDHVKSFIGIHKEFAEKGYVPKDRSEVTWMSINSVHKGSLMNHYGLFLPTLIGQASPEQLFLWAPKTLTFQIIGSYAQTELGHGSNVRGLQTEARFVRENGGSGHFVLNTPTLTSMKWWPGTLGKLATHCVLYAQLIIDDRMYGLHVFMLQLRDVNGCPLPGITVGDLGAKMGDEANDTGFLRLENVRVPREHMLAKGAIVTPEGKYFKTKAKKENPVIHYATMLSARCAMMHSSSGILAAGATISCRYSVIRTQGFQDTATNDYRSAEVKILDYQVQRYRVLKQVALSYVLAMTGNWLTAKVQLLTQPGLDDQELIASLPELHASAAGLKALSTLLTLAGLEDLRKCCGGNGYLMNSGIAQMVSSYAWQVSAEGDVVIMLLQTARFLMKSLESARRGEKLAGLVRSLEGFKDPGFKVSSLAPPKATSSTDFKNLEFLEHLFRLRTISAIAACGNELNHGAKKGLSADAAWNAAALNLVNTAKSHCFYFMLVQMKEQVAVSAKIDPAIGAVLHQLGALYACSEILDGQQWFGIIDADENIYLHQAVTELLDDLRPNAVALVNSFEIPDRVLNSTIGRADGNVYEALYQAAKESSLNKSDVFEGYEEVLKPHLDLELLANENKEPLVELNYDLEECEAEHGQPVKSSNL